MLISSFAFSGFAAEDTCLLLLGYPIVYGSGIKNSKAACYGKILADTCELEYENLSVPGSTSSNRLRRLEKDDVRESVKKHLCLFSEVEYVNKRI